MDIVSLLRLSIAERIGQDRFDLWFGQGTQLHVTKERVRIEVASQFALDWLRKHFRRDIEATISERLGGNASVEFRVNPNLAVGQSESKAGSRTRPKSPSSGKRKKTRELEETKSARRYTSLDSFVVGDCNRVAYTSAQVALNQLGQVSPIFLHGSTGVGKTHLLEGLIDGLRRNSKKKRAVYLTAEQFTSYFLEALHGKGLPSFRRRYRHVDLLIIDDVQFFVGKRATLEELTHTINTFIRENRQLAFAADRPPSHLTEMGPELIARLSGGLVCGLQSPDHTTRLRILESWTKETEPTIPRNVLQLVAERLPDDVRVLRGALNRLVATHRAFGEPITFAMTEKTLGDIFSSARLTVRLDEVEKAICDVFSVAGRDLKSNRRHKSLSQPRMLAMWLARRHTRAALSEIGHHFGGRSHSTVVSAQKTVENWIKQDESLQLANQQCNVQETIRLVERRLRAG